MDLSYITPRIIVMSFPGTDAHEHVYKNSAPEVRRFLHKYHKGHFKVFNVSQTHYDEKLYNEEGGPDDQDNLMQVNWEDHHAG